ncbi:MAG TPA: O-antigen ligase family protein [Thermoanaerobaculia bacterium]|nr:O-antigen ligase family protein [Thermoanaerobaculia bacterium]
MAAMIRHREAPAALLLAVALAVAALPFGAVMPGARTALAVTAFVALVLAVLLVRREDRMLRVRWPAGALLAVAAVGAIQLVPLPRFLVRVLSPNHARHAANADEALVAAGLEPSVAGVQLTLAPEVTYRTMLWLLAVAAALVAGHLAGRHRGERRLLAGAVVLAALFETLYGARQLMTSPRHIWGMEVPGVHTRLRGTFVNPNHLATYLVIAMCLVFAWGWWAWKRRRQVDALDARIFLLLPPIVVWLALFTGLTLTGSRVGLASAVLGTGAAVMLGVMAERQKTVRAVLALAGIGAAFVGIGIVLASVLGVDRTFGRLFEASAYDVDGVARARVYLHTLQLWLGYPVFGSGLGSFRDAFDPIQPRSLHGRWDHAHNDLFELLATGGLLSAVAIALGVFFLVRHLVHALSDGIRTEDRAAGLAGLAILVALGASETLDYGLTMPANAFTAAVLLGALAAASTRQYPSDTSEGDTEPPPRDTTSSR